MSKALSGIRVVEQGTFITGPCCGMMLADLGADVIKIESPGGDPYRSYQGGQYSPHFQAYNRNKRSLMLDMKVTSDRTLFDGLIREADVYIQNFRPGTAVRLGAAIERINESTLTSMVVTDTIPLRPAGQACEKIKVLSVARLLAEAI